MIFEYIQKALRKAEYKLLDNGTWFAEIPGFEGSGLMPQRRGMPDRTTRSLGGMAGSQNKGSRPHSGNRKS